MWPGGLRWSSTPARIRTRPRYLKLDSSLARSAARLAAPRRSRADAAEHRRLVPGACVEATTCARLRWSRSRLSNTLRHRREPSGFATRLASGRGGVDRGAYGLPSRLTRRGLRAEKAARRAPAQGGQRSRRRGWYVHSRCARSIPGHNRVPARVLLERSRALLCVSGLRGRAWNRDRVDGHLTGFGRSKTGSAELRPDSAARA